MIHRVSSSLATFNTLEFRPGMNILISEKHESSGEKQTRNKAGKSSFIEIVHYLFGANIAEKSIFKSQILKNESFEIELDIAKEKASLSRSLKTREIIEIVSGKLPELLQTKRTKKKLTENEKSIQEWKDIQGQFWFQLDQKVREERFRPSPRSLVSYFARRSEEGAFQKPEKYAIKQSTCDSQVTIAYMLDLDWKIAAQWQEIREKEKNIKALRTSMKRGDLGYIVGSSGELFTDIVKAEEAVKRIQNTLSDFQVHSEYRELESEVATTAQEITSLTNENALDEEILISIQDSLKNETMPEIEELQRLYSQVNIVLPELVKKRFDDVRSFHESVVSNRKAYLQAEIDSAKARLSERRNKIKAMDKRRSQIFNIFSSHGALDQFQKLQLECARKEADAQLLRKRYDAALQLEGQQTSLVQARASLEQLLSSDLHEQEEKVRRAIISFEEFSQMLYENQGSLNLKPTKNGLSIDINIPGGRSGGMNHMQVFTFDFMLLNICASRDIGPGFLIHDSHIFDGVDGRQVASALDAGRQIATKFGWQYIVTINEDQFESALEEGKESIDVAALRNAVLPVKLVDSPGGGLFGVEFN